MYPGSIPGEASNRPPAIGGGRAPLVDADRGRQMSIDYAAQRVKMVDGQVRTTDVTDLRIISAMLEVPREEFVPEKLRPLAYIDEDIALSAPQRGQPGRYLMEPSPFAKLVQLADVRVDDVVLDVGCASGYSSAVLSKLSGQVIALESDSALAKLATATLERLGCDNVAVVEGPLTEGYAAEAPYDVVFVGGAVERVPQALFDQLKDGGRLAVVEGRGNAGTARLYVKSGAAVAGRYAFNAAIKPLPGFEITPEFEF